MTIPSLLKTIANRALSHVNLRIDSLTAEKAELSRLETLVREQHFTRQVLPLTDAMAHSDHGWVLAAVDDCARDFEQMRSPEANSTRYSFVNAYFSSPDAEVLYGIVRNRRPARIIEVGCGYSTRVSRLAIRSARLSTKVTCIDPHPRLDVTSLCDAVFACEVEKLRDRSLFADLDADDILFIDSSHEVKPGNDVVYLYSHILPALRRGVLVHIHDIFLPYEYPYEWVVRERWPWAEAYIVQAILAFGDAFEVVWPGHYLQRTLPGFGNHFPDFTRGNAQSLWLRKS